jgi:type IV secretion system protein VirD4
MEPAVKRRRFGVLWKSALTPIRNFVNWAKRSLWFAAIAFAILATIWLAGFLFLAMSGVAPAKSASLTSFASYAYWYSNNPKIEAWLYVSGFLSLLICGSPFALAFIPAKEKLHGAARWARTGEIRKAGLLGEQGIVVGALGSKLLRHGGAAMVSPHVYLAAPTGSGKTQAVVLPNVLSWQGSLLALDIKGELYSQSAGFRAGHGQKVFMLNFTPRDYKTHQYNPFAFISEDPNFLVADVQRITNYLIQLGKGDDFWPQEARRLFIAVALYLHGTGETPTLPRIRALALVGADGKGFQNWCKSVSNDTALKARLHPEAVMSLGNFATSAENTVAGVVQTVTSGLMPFINELTAKVVSGNSFDLRKLRDEAMSIYLVIQPADFEQLAPVVRLFFQQAVDLQTNVEYGKSTTHKHLVLLAMDEFATIGKVPAIQQSIAFMRSYGLRLLAIVQSDAQVEGVYERSGAKSFMDNFGCAVFFTPAAKDLQSAETISKILGNKTVDGRSKTRRGFWTSDDKSKSETTSDQKRPLMLPQDVLRMPSDKGLLIMSGVYPMKVNKLFAARDIRFRSRIIPAPEVPLITMAAPVSVVTVSEPTETEFLVDDLEVMRSLDLSDLSLDFSEIEIPKEPASAEEVESLCHLILDRIMLKDELVIESR